MTSGSEKNDIALKRRGVRISPASGPVQTNPFSDENGAVLLRFQLENSCECECVHTYRFRQYRFRPFTLLRRIRFETLLNPQCARLNELDTCAFQYIGPRNWREIEATW